MKNIALCQTVSVISVLWSLLPAMEDIHEWLAVPEKSIAASPQMWESTSHWHATIPISLYHVTCLF